MALRAQLSVELVIMAAVMIGLLLAMFLVNDYLRSSWESQKESFQASAAATKLAMAINRASAAGDGTIIGFFNRVENGVTNMSVYDRRSVRAYYLSEGYESAPLVTNNTNISGSIPLNQMVFIKNRNGTITIEAT